MADPDKDYVQNRPVIRARSTVGADTKLDYDSNKKTYMVTVTATDPSQAMTTIDVTIMVVDVNEAPEFTAPSEGDVERTVQENTRSLSIDTFRATDPEGQKVYWSLDDNPTDSPDMDRFTITDNGMLSLKDSPNYEDDTQYMVVVVASDDAPGAGIPDTEDPIMSSMKTVTVTVTDVGEPGTITLAPKYPHVGNPVTPTLMMATGRQQIASIGSGRSAVEPPHPWLIPTHTARAQTMLTRRCGLRPPTWKTATTRWPARSPRELSGRRRSRLTWILHSTPAPQTAQCPKMRVLA